MSVSSSAFLFVGQRVHLKRLHLMAVNSVFFFCKDAVMEVQQQVGHWGCCFCSPQRPACFPLLWFSLDFCLIASGRWAQLSMPAGGFNPPPERRVGDEPAKAERSDWINYRVGLAGRPIFEQWLSFCGHGSSIVHDQGIRIRYCSSGQQQM